MLRPIWDAFSGKNYAEKHFCERKFPNQGTYMGTVIAQRPKQCGTTAKTSECQRAGLIKKGGGGGPPPATLCVRAFSRESLDPRPGPGGDPPLRSGPATVPTEPPAEGKAGPPSAAWHGPPLLPGGKKEREGAPRPRGGIHPHIPALAGGDLPHQVQADAHPRLVLDRRGPVEPLEHLDLLLLRQTRAGVGHVDAAEEFVKGDRDGDSPPGGGVFHPVVQEVAHRLPRPFGVKAGSGPGGLQGEGEPFLRRPGGELGHRLLQHGPPPGWGWGRGPTSPSPAGRSSPEPP